VAKPDHADKRAAIKQCKAERGKTKATRTAFKAKYHSFSRCVRQNAAEEHAEKQAALKNAAKQCKAERADPDFAASHDGKSFGPGRRSGGPGLQERRQGVRRGAVGPRLPRRARRQVVRGLLREQPQQAQRVRQVRLEQGAAVLRSALVATT
jgi:hypothetical protein